MSGTANPDDILNSEADPDSKFLGWLELKLSADDYSTVEGLLMNVIDQFSGERPVGGTVTGDRALRQRVAKALMAQDAKARAAFNERFPHSNRLGRSR